MKVSSSCYYVERIDCACDICHYFENNPNNNTYRCNSPLAMAPFRRTMFKQHLIYFNSALVNQHSVSSTWTTQRHHCHIYLPDGVHQIWFNFGEDIFNVGVCI